MKVLISRLIKFKWPYWSVVCESCHQDIEVGIQIDILHGDSNVCFCRDCLQAALNMIKVELEENA